MTDHSNARPGSFSRRDALIAGGVSLAAPALARAHSLQPAGGGGGGGGSGGERGGVGGGRAAKPLDTVSYRFKVGELDCLSIPDGSMQMPLKPLWAPEASEEQVKQALRDEFLPDNVVTAYINILVVRTGNEIILIDTGNGAGAGMLLPRLSAAGIEPASVTGVVLTHLHGDHIGGLSTAGSPTFPNAAVFINTAERDFWASAKPEDIKNALPVERKQGSIDSARKAIAGVGNALQAVKPGDKLPGGLEFVEAYGHTPGHCGVRITSGNDTLLHIADTAHNHAIMLPHPEWSVMFDTDAAPAIATRKKLFAQAAAERTRLYAYHLPWPGIGHLRAEGQGYRWVAEPWMFS